ncbi:MAG: hypothetical protein ACP5H2_11515, partial [Solirubrobacteraceae bacterium]
VASERGPDTQACVSVVDRESAEQKRRDWIRRALAEGFGRCGAVYTGHRDARVCDDDVARVGDHPGGRGVAAAVLAGVSAEPFVEYRLAAVEPFAIVDARIERRWTLQLSQAS